MVSARDCGCSKVRQGEKEKERNEKKFQESCHKAIFLHAWYVTPLFVLPSLNSFDLRVGLWRKSRLAMSSISTYAHLQITDRISVMPNHES